MTERAGVSRIIPVKNIGILRGRVKFPTDGDSQEKSVNRIAADPV